MEFTLELVRQIVGHDPQMRDAWRDRWTRLKKLQHRGSRRRSRDSGPALADQSAQTSNQLREGGEGNKAARQEAADIVAQARRDAESLLAEAREQADEILRNAKQASKEAARRNAISPAVARLMTRESLRIVMLGRPGAGKGTQGMYLKEILGIPKVHIGDVWRENIMNGEASGLLASEIMDRGDLIPDELFMNMLSTRLNRPDVADGFLLDGVPRNVNQSGMLDAMLNERGNSINVGLYFDVPLTEATTRLAGRRICSKDSSHVYHMLYSPPLRYNACDICEGALVSRSDDSRQVIKNRWYAWGVQTDAVVAAYGAAGRLVTVSGVGSVEEVTDRAVGSLAAFFG